MEDLMSFDTIPCGEAAAPSPRSALVPESTPFTGDDLVGYLDTLPSTMPTSESNAGNLIDLTEEVVHKGSRNITLDHMLRRSRHAVDLPQPPLMEQWVHDKKQKALAGLSNIPVPPGHAYFVLSHDRELEKGVIEAVHVEMLAFMKGQTDIFIQVQGPKIRPFLYIEAPNQDLITACLDEARAWADNIINDKTAKLDLVFVEPPTSDHSSFEIMRRGARPEMVPSVEDSSASDQLLFSHSVFEKSFVQQLTSGLKKAGRIKDKINLRVHIGRYVLTSVRRPPGLDQDDEQRFSFQEFSRIMRQSRARGRFLTYTGELAEALCVLRSIKNNDKVFLAGDMALATGEVEPEFYFDAESSKWRLEAHLHRRGEVMAANHELRSALEVAGVRAVEIVEGRENIQLDFKTLSLGQTFDWKISTISDRLVKTTGYNAMETEIRAAAILFPRDTNKVRDRDYPRLQFRNGKKVKELRRVAIRSVFRFRYNPSPYQIELTIRREWPSATAMSDNTMEPITTFEIMVYGDHWGETRASEVSKTDQGWGQELEYLFRPIVDEGGNNCLDTYTNGEHKVQAMVDVVHDIRNALSS